MLREYGEFVLVRGNGSRGGVLMHPAFWGRVSPEPLFSSCSGKRRSSPAVVLKKSYGPTGRAGMVITAGWWFRRVVGSHHRTRGPAVTRHLNSGPPWDHRVWRWRAGALGVKFRPYIGGQLLGAMVGRDPGVAALPPRTWGNY